MDITLDKVDNITVCFLGKNLTDQVWMEIKRWCDDQYGNSPIRQPIGRWRWNWEHDTGDEFHFTREEDAILFLLRWS